MAELLDMGKYGVFIWAAYGISTAVIVGLMIWILGQRKKVRRQLLELEHKMKSTAEK